MTAIERAVSPRIIYPNQQRFLPSSTIGANPFLLRRCCFFEALFYDWEIRIPDPTCCLYIGFDANGDTNRDQAIHKRPYRLNFMRLRLQTDSTDLPSLKAWFPFIPEARGKGKVNENGKVLDFKKAVCETVKAFAEAGVGFRDVVCEVEGFELLDELKLEGIVSEGDLVIFKRRGRRTEGSGGGVGVGQKRKAEDAGDVRVSAKRRKAMKEISSSESEEEVSSESSSDSDSSSSSSSSSSEEEDSDSDSGESSSSSSSSSSAPPSVAPSKPKILVPVKQTSAKLSSESFVPPGQGSAQTHKRNVRRRIKKKYDAVAAKGLIPPPTVAPPPPKRASEANSAPLGNVRATTTAAEGVDTSARQTDELNRSMLSLGNKNKKKGFKHALVMPMTGKKVFGDRVVEASATPEARSSLESTINRADMEVDGGSLPPSADIFTDYALPVPLQRSEGGVRLIPPSERQEMGALPRNMFVTSIDVEEGVSAWAKKKHQRKLIQRQLKGATGKEFVDAIATSKAVDLDAPQRNKRKRVSEVVFAAPTPGGWEAVGNEEVQQVEPVSEGFVDKDNAGYGVEDMVVLDYGEQDGEDSKSALIWTVAEEKFDSCKTVELEDITAGMLVGWKGLGINPSTFTPEVLLHVATVTAHSVDEKTISIRKLVRPGGEELVEDDLDSAFKWDEVVEMKWKVLDSIQQT